MEIPLTRDDLLTLKLSVEKADRLFTHLKAQYSSLKNAKLIWQAMSFFLNEKGYPFSVHLFIFKTLYPNWHNDPQLAPAWLPDEVTIANANLTECMNESHLADLKSFHRFSYQNPEAFISLMVKRLGIKFSKSPTQILNLEAGLENPQWFWGGKLNITDSCFGANPKQIAIIESHPQGLNHYTYQDLQDLANSVANSLIHQGLKPNDRVGIIMTMNALSIGIYLGIIKMGGVVVSIADSFSEDEIKTRLDIAKPKLIFTQYKTTWENKTFKLYHKISHSLKTISFKRPIVICIDEKQENLDISDTDLNWNHFFSHQPIFESYANEPNDDCHILFSSGTTHAPKAIAWNHTTPLKAGFDAHLHQNIKPHDILTWPTNLGWMMGPWLIFATFLNRATIALYHDSPKGRSFGEFVQNAKVTMLGVVPTLVASWHQSACMEGLDFSSINVLTSTGECSKPEDMLYLMYLTAYKPIIEYCGGTEIGGAYVSSTLIQENYPSLFSTPTMGLNFFMLNDSGKPAKTGEVIINAIGIGLTTKLLNANHHEVYFSDLPSHKGYWRKHGDLIHQFNNGYFILLGRADDSMNLGGIKVSAIEIERVLNDTPCVKESAAIGVSPKAGGPSHLIIYAVLEKSVEQNTLAQEMQQKINQYLNPLFKIHQVIIVNDLPKTASNKIMRRQLRKNYSIEKE